MATKTKLTEKQVQEGFDTFSKWHPEEAASLQKHRDTIIRHVVEGTNPNGSSPVITQSYAKVSNLQLEANQSLEFTPCTEAIAVFITDVVFFILDVLVGLHVNHPVEKSIAKALLRVLGDKMDENWPYFVLL